MDEDDIFPFCNVENRDVYEFAIRCRSKLWEQIDLKLSKCVSHEEKSFVNEGTFHFLLLSLMKLMSELDDDRIEMVADQVRNRLMQLKRK